MQEEIKELYKENHIVCIEDIMVARQGNTDLYMDILKTEDRKAEKPCIVWIHGGAWNIRELDRKYRPDKEMILFLKAGYSIASIEYRLIQDGQFPACIKDCKLAIRFLRANGKRYGIHTEKIYAWGESAGAHLAGLLAVTKGKEEWESEEYSEYSSAIEGACLWYPPVRFTTMCSDADAELVGTLIGADPRVEKEKADYASPYTYIHEDTPPILIMHGTEDTLVPVLQSEDFVKKLEEVSKQPVYFIRVPGQGHGFFQGEKYYRQILQFFDTL